jgi:methyl-accepting chemotaxis protein
VGVLGVYGVTTINSHLSDLYLGQTKGIAYVKDATTDLYGIRMMLRAAVLDEDQAKIDSDIKSAQDFKQKFTASMESLRPLLTTDKGRELYDKTMTDYQQFITFVDEVLVFAKDDKDDEALAAIAQAGDVTTAMLDYLNQLNGLKVEVADQRYQSSNEIFKQTQFLIFIVSGVIVLFGFGIAFFLARSISSGVGQMAKVADGISNGELEHQITVKSKDEVGDMAQSFIRMTAYLNTMAEAANQMASGDLTHDVTPISDRDVLGNAFAQMIMNLRISVAEVQDNAESLAAASQQLSSASNQAGEATNQIATTIQQIAQGTSQQSESISNTVQSVEMVGQSIQDVARGAREQAAGVQKASYISNQVSTSLQKLAEAAQGSADGGSAAQAASKKGVETVENTIKAMQSIQDKVGQSATKVREMGDRSDQIGAIVETIEDIASQTNLLALNAAIEAARAGEHGKGFAVVADEVRKLAEKSASATKEIAGLIRGIQGTVQEAVMAMEAGAKEVEVGVTRANEAGAALDSITETAQTVYKGGIEAVDVAKQALLASSELVSAMESVSAVVEENTAATDEMNTSAGKVTSAMENIASISEENSAAVEEVSASAEEMSAQVEEVTASAQSLTEMAESLSRVAARFKLNRTARAAVPASVQRPALKAGGFNKSMVPVRK